MKLTSSTAEWPLKLKLSVRVIDLRVLLLLEHGIFEFDYAWRDIGKLIIFVLTVAGSVAGGARFTLSMTRMRLSRTSFRRFREIRSLPNGGGLVHLLIFREFITILAFGGASSRWIVEPARGPSRPIYCHWSTYWGCVGRVLRERWLQCRNISTSMHTRPNRSTCFAEALRCHQQSSLLCINFAFPLLKTHCVDFCPLLIRRCFIAPSNLDLNTRVLEI